MPKEKRDRDQLYRIIASLDGHFATDDISPADQDRWRALKRHVVRMKDGLGLARLELESGARAPEQAVRKALEHVAVRSRREREEGLSMPLQGRSLKRLQKKAKRGMRGWPAATIAFYGPDATRATKVAAAFQCSRGDSERFAELFRPAIGLHRIV